MISYSITLKSEELYLGLYDVHSPANTPDLWNKLLRDAMQRAGDEPTGLYYFNQAWADLLQARNLLVWVLLFDGVYQIKVELPERDKHDTAGGDQMPFVGSHENHAQISLPTGEVIVGSLSRLGASIPASFTVPPGLYEASLFSDEDAQQQHMFLTDVVDYPLGDGPDWTLYLRNVALYGQPDTR